MGNSFGSALRLTIFGQSHAPAIGMCMEGFPVGFRPDMDALEAFLARRAPGQGAHTTARREADKPEFLSGLVNGHTCDAPLAAIIRNTDTRPQDYGNLSDMPRPSHADYPAYVKYGADRDGSGGGKFSGRLTAPLCIAGGLCLQWLAARGIRIGAHVLQIGPVMDTPFDPLSPQIPVPVSPLPTLKPDAAEAMLAEIAAARRECDSVGGIIECAVTGLPTGVGEPMFGGLENRLAQILFAISAVKGVEFGSGFSCAAMRGSEHNDAYYSAKSGVCTRTNHAGGILGGLSTGMPVLFRTAIKPTPSISRPQETVFYNGGDTTLEIKGRHDPCIVPRAVPCVEAAAAVAIMDAILEGKLWN